MPIIVFVPFSVPITIYFGNGSKVTTKVSPLDTTSDLLESIKDQLTSSSTQLWLIDQSGVGKTGSLHACIDVYAYFIHD